MADNKNYSLADLYEAAFGRKPAFEEIAYLSNLSKEELDQSIKRWAEWADWNVLPVIGLDGRTHLVFYPKWGKRLS